MAALKNSEILTLLFGGQSEQAKLFTLYNKNKYITVSKKGTDGYYFNDNTKLWTELSNCEFLNDVINFLHKMTDTQIEILKKKLSLQDDIDDDDKKNWNNKIAKLEKLRISNSKAAHGKSIIEFIVSSFFQENFMNKLDTDESILPIKNGKCINLKTLEIRDRTNNDYFTYELNVDYTKTIDKATKFFSELMSNDKSKLSVFQRMLGYSITGNCDMKCYFVLIGSGDNGKSALMRVIQTIFKPLFVAIQKSLLFTENRNKNDMMPYLAVLAGKRFGVYNEPAKNIEINESMVKAITGGDEIVAKKLYRDPFTFTPIVKMWILSNEIVKFDSCSEPMIKRTKLIHMTSEFVDNPKKTQFKKDPEFVRSLESEYSSEIFSFIALGAHLFYQTKSFGEDTCESMKKYKSDYIDNIDISQSFLNDCCNIDDKHKIKTSELFEAFVEYCKEHDLTIVKRNEFYRSLTNKKLNTKKINGTFYYSIKLNDVHNNSDTEDELEKNIESKHPLRECNLDVKPIKKTKRIIPNSKKFETVESVSSKSNSSDSNSSDSDNFDEKGDMENYDFFN